MTPARRPRPRRPRSLPGPASPAPPPPGYSPALRPPALPARHPHRRRRSPPPPARAATPRRSSLRMTPRTPLATVACVTADRDRPQRVSLRHLSSDAASSISEVSSTAITIAGRCPLELAWPALASTTLRSIRSASIGAPLVPPRRGRRRGRSSVGASRSLPPRCPPPCRLARCCSQLVVGVAAVAAVGIALGLGLDAQEAL
eukprot:6472721-Prymnesium_polylepis.1